MQNLTMLIVSNIVLSIVLISLVVIIFIIENRGKKNDKFTREIFSDTLKRLNKYEISGGFTEKQIEDMRKRILTHFGRDLNDMQVITIMINWRNTYEQLGAEMEFIEAFIKERKW